MREGVRAEQAREAGGRAPLSLWMHADAAPTCYPHTVHNAAARSPTTTTTTHQELVDRHGGVDGDDAAVVVLHLVLLHLLGLGLVVVGRRCVGEWVCERRPRPRPRRRGVVAVVCMHARTLCQARAQEDTRVRAGLQRPSSSLLRSRLDTPPHAASRLSLLSLCVGVGARTALGHSSEMSFIRPLIPMVASWQGGGVVKCGVVACLCLCVGGGWGWRGG